MWYSAIIGLRYYSVWIMLHVVPGGTTESLKGLIVI